MEPVRILILIPDFLIVLRGQNLKFIYSEKATKFCKISTVVPVKSTVEISQYFVAFSEYMNFTKKRSV